MQFSLSSAGQADDWQIFLWNLPEDFVSRPQKLVFMMMLEAQFNAFDPYRVVEDLLRCRELWDGVVMERGFPLHTENGSMPSHIHGDLIGCDIGKGHWNVDTLYVLTTPEQEAAWEPILRNWNADEVGFERGDARQNFSAFGGVRRNQCCGYGGINDERKGEGETCHRYQWLIEQ